MCLYEYGGLAKILGASGASDFRSCCWLPRGGLVFAAANTRADLYCGVADWCSRRPIRGRIGTVA